MSANPSLESARGASVPSSCPRCGRIDATTVETPLPQQPGASYVYHTCPRCSQVLVPTDNIIYDSDRNPDYAAPFTYGRSLVHVPGQWRRLPVVPPITDDVLSKIRATFIPRDNDIWLATYPKCGTTWIQNVLSHLVYGNTDAGQGPVQVGLRLADDMLWLDALCGIHGTDMIIEHVNSMSRDRPRMFKSHAPLGLLEPVVAANAKVIHVARNSKDVAVSFWHHTVAKNEPYEGDFQHFFEKLYMPGELESGSYFDFVLPYCKATERWEAISKADDVLPVTQVTTVWYEKMTSAPVATVLSLAAFLRQELSTEMASDICEACSFDRMKSTELKHGTRLSSKTLVSDTENNHGDKDKACVSHIRKGGVGGWRDYLSEAQSSSLDVLLLQKCEEYDISIDC